MINQVLGYVFTPQFLVIALFVASGLYVHFRGRVRHKFSRQLTDHSTFTAPYNAFTYLCSAVPNKPFLDTADFPELGVLRENWQTIRAESLALADRIKAADSYNDLGFNSFFRRGWKRFYLKWYADFFPSARELCPRTVELLAQIPNVHGAMFASMAPRSRLVKHRDPFAGTLRYHLGLVTPNSEQCRINIDGEDYHWRDGQDVLFDETYIHRATNDTDEERIILFCDVERPLRFAFATKINRWVIRHLIKASRTRNVAGEKIGILNYAFNVVYRIRLPLKHLKKAHKQVYYGLKYAVMAGLLFLVL